MCHISLSGKRVCDSPSIRVSEISVYYENRLVVPTLGKHIYATFRESMKIFDSGPTNHMTSQ